VSPSTHRASKRRGVVDAGTGDVDSDDGEPLEDSARERSLRLFLAQHPPPPPPALYTVPAFISAYSWMP
jgi:hypothetical protein